MKKKIVPLLVAGICLCLAACGESKTDVEDEQTQVQSTEEATEAADENVIVSAEAEETEPEIDYTEVIPSELQGVWGDTATENILTLYAFKDDQIETYVVNFGEGAASVLSGTYTVGSDKINYNFGSSTGYSNFTYENDTFAMTNANGAEIKKLSATDIIGYLTQEETSANNKGVICLANLIINYYPDSAECSTATEKKDAANTAIKEAGEAALQNLNTSYDQVQQLTWYQHKTQPQYTDIRTYVYPYIGRSDDGNTWLRVVLNYTDAQTDAGWIFFTKVIFSVDGENTTKTFSYNDILRDNDTEVWEVADFEPNASEIELLRSIANSTQTIVRFQGDNYYEDHIVTDEEKSAITDVLTAYDYLTNYTE